MKNRLIRKYDPSDILEKLNKNNFLLPFNLSWDRGSKFSQSSFYFNAIGTLIFVKDSFLRY